MGQMSYQCHVLDSKYSAVHSYLHEGISVWENFYNLQ